MNVYTDRRREPTYKALLALLDAWGIQVIRLPAINPGDDGEAQAIRQHQSIVDKSFYHQTKLALQCYRELSAVYREKKRRVEANPENVNWRSLAQNHPTDEGLSANDRLIYSLNRTAELLHYMEDALDIVKKTRANGHLYHSMLYYTYFSKKEYKATEIPGKIKVKDGSRGISQTSYYRNMPNAIRLYSEVLWAAPNPDLNAWFDLLCLFQASKEDMSFMPDSPPMISAD